MDATHEVADCGPEEVVAPPDAIWEHCLLLREKKTSFDVQIVSDGEKVRDVPKRFVRPLPKERVSVQPNVMKQKQKRKRKRSSSYGWTQHELELLKEAESARIQALREGKPASQRISFIRKYLLCRNVVKRYACDPFLTVFVCDFK